MSTSLFLLNSRSFHLFWNENEKFKVLNVVDLNFESSASAIEFDLFLFRYLPIDFLSILAVQAVDLETVFIRRKLLIKREIRNKPIFSRLILMQVIFPNASIYNFLVSCNTLPSLLLVRTLTLPKVCSKFLSQTSAKLLLKARSLCCQSNCTML